MGNRRDSIGKAGEEAAAAYYLKNGYTLAARNYRTRQGEIDIIAIRGELLVFAEVKSRSEGSIAAPREWVDARKQKRIFLAAEAYLQEKEISEPPVRFDVVEVYCKNGGGMIIECIENAFSL